MKVLISVLLCCSTPLFISQTPIKPFPEFGVTAGYTFGGGIQYGFNVELKSGYETALMGRQTAGVEYQFQFQTVRTRYKVYTHRLTNIRVVYDCDNTLRIKAGYARIRNPWGLGERNLCAIKGFSFGLEGGTHGAWVGYQEICYKLRNWAWFDRPYRSVLLRYSLPDPWAENKMKNSGTK